MDTFPMIPYREFDRLLEEGAIRQIIDLREPWLYARERIWGSVNIPYEELEYRLNQVNCLGMVVFYCDRGAKSMLACRRMARMGCEAADLAGGMANYRGKYIDRRPLSALE